jgi:hypothetical protein
MMALMMGFMIAVAFLLLVFILGIARNTDGKAKRTELEKPKRHRLSLSDDGELVEINEDETALLYDREERQ